MSAATEANSAEAMNPYKVLGVEKTALAADIKHAYLQLVKAWHPDSAAVDALEQGIDLDVLRAIREQKMRILNKAYAILSDPVRRARYDASGDIDVSARVEKARSMLKQFANVVISSEIKDGDGGSSETTLPWAAMSAPRRSPVVCVDILGKIRQQLAKLTRDLEKEITKSKAMLKAYRRYRVTVRRRAEATGSIRDDIFNDLFTSWIENTERVIAANEDQLKTVKEAVLLLDDYEFVPPPDAADGASPDTTQWLTYQAFKSEND